MANYCVSCEAHWGSWIASTYTEDRYKQIGSSEFDVYRALLGALSELGVSSANLNDLSAAVRRRGKGSVMVRVDSRNLEQFETLRARAD